jgi:hypothetical protein
MAGFYKNFLCEKTYQECVGNQKPKDKKRKGWQLITNYERRITNEKKKNSLATFPILSFPRRRESCQTIARN